MKYPELANQLMALLREDQRSYKSFARLYHSPNGDLIVLLRRKALLRKKSSERAVRMLEIVHDLKIPTLSNVGQEASEAIAVLALHGKVEVMEEILSLFVTGCRQYPEDMYYQAIPALTDRTLILNGAKQLFGTQWLPGEDGKPFLYPVKNYRSVNARRARYGLQMLRRPRVVALPAEDPRQVPPQVFSSDMRMPTEKEFHEFADGHI